MAAGVPGAVLVKSTLWELGFIAVAGLLYAWLILPLFLPGFSSIVCIILLLGAVWVVAYLLRRVIGPQIAMSFGWQMRGCKIFCVNEYSHLLPVGLPGLGDCRIFTVPLAGKASKIFLGGFFCRCLIYTF
jgi:hypothetical protein